MLRVSYSSWSAPPQTVAALEPKAASGFDFSPGDLLAQRSQNSYYHLVAISPCAFARAARSWTDYSTAFAPPAVPPYHLFHRDRRGRSHADPAARHSAAHRAFVGGGSRRAIVLRFALTNRVPGRYRSARWASRWCSTTSSPTVRSTRRMPPLHLHPYIGQDAGYLQVAVERAGSGTAGYAGR
jgi:hypothetical protein